MSLSPHPCQHWVLSFYHCASNEIKMVWSAFLPLPTSLCILPGNSQLLTVPSGINGSLASFAWSSSGFCPCGDAPVEGHRAPVRSAREAASEHEGETDEVAAREGIESLRRTHPFPHLPFAWVSSEPGQLRKSFPGTGVAAPEAGEGRH